MESSRTKWWTHPKMTPKMKSQARPIAGRGTGTRIRPEKLGQLQRLYPKAERRAWKKMKTVDEHGQEWYYYYNPAIGNIGWKPKGESDPF